MRRASPEVQKISDTSDTSKALEGVYKQMNRLAPYILSVAGVGVASALDSGVKRDTAFAAQQL